MAYQQLPRRNNNATPCRSAFSLPVSFQGGFLSRFWCCVLLNKSESITHSSAISHHSSSSVWSDRCCKTFFFRSRGSLKGNLPSPFVFLFTLNPRGPLLKNSLLPCTKCLLMFEFMSIKTERFFFFFSTFQPLFFHLLLGIVPRFKLLGLFKPSFCLCLSSGHENNIVHTELEEERDGALVSHVCHWSGWVIHPPPHPPTVSTGCQTTKNFHS